MFPLFHFIILNIVFNSKHSIISYYIVSCSNPIQTKTNYKSSQLPLYFSYVTGSVFRFINYHRQTFIYDMCSAFDTVQWIYIRRVVIPSNWKKKQSCKCVHVVKIIALKLRQVLNLIVRGDSHHDTRHKPQSLLLFIISDLDILISQI